MNSIETIEMIEMINWNDDEYFNYQLLQYQMENQFDLMFVDIENMEIGQAKFPQHGHMLTYPIGYNYDGGYRN